MGDVSFWEVPARTIVGPCLVRYAVGDGCGGTFVGEVVDEQAEEGGGMMVLERLPA